MSLTYGFYNSVNGDRLYNALQMSSLFDGILNDGVFESIGDKLMVTPATGMNVTIGTGRAWFNRTWTNNDSDIILAVDASQVAFNRTDVIVLEVNSSDSVRTNAIKVVKGSPVATPNAASVPTLINTEFVHQYPLAYIYVDASLASITSDYITNKVGTVDCPYAKGILRTTDTESIEAIEATVVDVNADIAVLNNKLDLITTTGSANAYIATYPTPMTSYYEGMILLVKPNFDNAAGGATINVDSLGAKTICRYNYDVFYNACYHDMKLNCPAMLIYDGTYFILLNPLNQGISKYKASDTVVLSASTERYTSNPAYTTMKTFRILRKGTIRIKGQYHGITGESWSNAYIRIINTDTGEVVGSEISTASASYVDFTYTTIPISAGDSISLQMLMTGYNNVFVRDVTVCYDVENYFETTVMTD